MKNRFAAALLVFVVCLTLAQPASAETNTKVPMDHITTNGTPLYYNKEKGWITFSDSSTGNGYIIDRKTGLQVSEYDICLPYTDGMALVAKMDIDKYQYYAGFIDVEGNLTIPLRYDMEEIGLFSYGLAPYVDGRAAGFIDKTGTVVIPPISKMTSYIAYYGFIDGLAPVWNDDGIYEYIDTEGNVVLPINDGYGGEFSDGRAPFKVKVNDSNSKYGYIDKSGALVIPAEYDYANLFINGMALVGKTGDTGMLYGYIDANGNEIISCQYTAAEPFIDNCALVKYGEEEYLIDTEGNIILKESDCQSVRFNSYANESHHIYENGLISVNSDEGSGFINIKGDIIVPTTYEHSGILYGVDEDNPGLRSGLSDTLFWVKNGDDYYFFDSPYQDGKNAGSTSVPYALIAVGLLVAVGLIGVAAVVIRKKKSAVPVEASLEQPTAAPAQPSIEHNFCTTCGSPLPEGCRFCPRCGKEVKK